MAYSIFRSIFALGLSYAVFAAPAFAAPEETVPKKAATENASTLIERKLSAVRPDLEFKVLGESLLPGMYEVQVDGGPLLFVSKDGSHFIDGNLYQITATQFIDLKEIRLTAMRREIFTSRNTDDMIIFKPQGDSKVVINVFTDIDCGYCRKLHKEIPMLNAMGVEVRYLAYPRAGLESESYLKIATAWCADDPNKALTNFKNGKDSSISICDDNPVAKHFALGGAIGVTGTPAIILMDGTLLPGYRSAADFAQLLGLDVQSN
ncbi:MAG: DsbC family protein [Pseudomonadales bacterium]